MNDFDIRSRFPWFLYHDKAVYFDNAATTFKLAAGIERVEKYLSQESVNISRGRYPLALSVEHDVGKIRNEAASFFNVQSTEIFFTSGATDAAEKFIVSFGLASLKNNDEVLYSLDDHESTVRPVFVLQKILEKQGIRIRVRPYRSSSTGEIDLRSLRECITDSTRLIIITHVNNKTGYVQNIKAITDILPEKCVCAVDASQSVARVPVSTNDLSRVGAMWFSGHKIFADTGVGVLYVSKYIQEEIYKKNDADMMFVEHGTLPISSILSLSASFDFLKTIGLVEIKNRLSLLQHHLVRQLLLIPGIYFLQGNNREILQNNAGILSFGFEKIRSDAAAQFLSDHDVFVRTGSLCSFNKKSIDTYADVVRVSMQVYNTTDEIDYFINRTKELLRL